MNCSSGWREAADISNYVYGFFLKILYFTLQLTAGGSNYFLTIRGSNETHL